jgi:hypothetical protein
MTPAASLWPREHGAYAELAFPLATGLTLAGPSTSGGCLALAALLLFLAHEPLAVASGARGARRRLTTGPRAWRRFLVLAAGACVIGVCGILLGGPAVRTAVLVPLVPAAAVTPWLVRGRQKTLRAEVLIVAAFACVTVPLVVAGGGSWRLGWLAAAVWFVSFGLGTVAVHGLKLYHKGRPGAAGLRIGVLMLGGTVCTLGFLAATAGHVPLLAAASLVPPVVVASIVSVAYIHPRRLMTVGWSLVSANAITLICLLLL